ncbi:unnamed protein product [Notodromas monacha]|uniref:Uncharacterized protein n=1 Tax=Notodromas monacha TaxID=399045 RepID=A0A7R9BS37_9CRUS|nr:unnamed protein product [Notodromas monacha]CAG0920673.1 unnamed protein product [Notodromas monacha]
MLILFFSVVPLPKPRPDYLDVGEPIDCIAWNEQFKCMIVASRKPEDISKCRLSVYDDQNFSKLCATEHGNGRCVCLAVYPKGEDICSIFAHFDNWQLVVWTRGMIERWRIRLPSSATPVRLIQFSFIPDDSADFVTFGSSAERLSFWKERELLLGDRLHRTPASFLTYQGCMNIESAAKLSREDIWITNADGNEDAFLLWSSSQLVACISATPSCHTEQLMTLNENFIAISAGGSVRMWKLVDILKTVDVHGITHTSSVGLQRLQFPEAGETFQVQETLCRARNLSAKDSNEGIISMLVTFGNGSISRIEMNNGKEFVIRGLAGVQGIAMRNVDDEDIAAVIGVNGEVYLWKPRVCQELFGIGFIRSAKPTCVAWARGSLLIGDESGHLHELHAIQQPKDWHSTRVFEDSACVAVVSHEEFTGLVSRDSEGFIFRIGEESLEPMFRIPLKLSNARLCFLKACSSAEKIVLGIWGEQSGVFAIVRVAEDFECVEDSYLILRDSYAVSIVHISGIRENGDPETQNRGKYAEIFSCAPDVTRDTCWALCHSDSEDAVEVFLVEISIETASCLRRIEVPSVGWVTTGFLNVFASHCCVFLASHCSTVAVKRISLFEETSLEDVCVKISDGEIVFAGTETLSLVGDGKGSVVVLLSERSAEFCDEEIPIMDLGTVDVKHSLLVDNRRADNAIVNRKIAGEKVKVMKREAIKQLRSEMADIRKANSQLPFALRLPETSFTSSPEVFSEINAEYERKVLEIRREREPALRAAKNFEEKLKFSFLSRWQWQETVCSFDDGFMDASQRLRLRTWRVERPAEDLHSKLASDVKKMLEDDDIFLKLGFTGCNQCFRLALKNASVPKERILRHGIKTEDSIFPGDVTLPRKRAELSHVRVRLLDFCSSFNASVLSLMAQFNAAKLELESIIAKLGQGIGMESAQEIVAGGIRNKGVIPTRLLDDILPTRSEIIQARDVESDEESSAGTSESGKSPEVLEFKGILGQKANAGNQGHLSVLEERLLRHTRSALLHEAEKAVATAYALHIKLINKYNNLKEKAVKLSLAKEVGELRVLELGEQVAVLEETEQLERDVIERLKAAYEFKEQKKAEEARVKKELDEKIKELEGVKNAMARLDDEADAIFFAYPRHVDQLRLVYMRRSSVSDLSEASDLRSSFGSRRASYRSTKHGPVAIPGIEETRQLSAFRQKSEADLHAVSVARIRIESDLASASNAVSVADTQLQSVLGEHSVLLARKMKSLHDLQTTLILTAPEADKYLKSSQMSHHVIIEAKVYEALKRELGEISASLVDNSVKLAEEKDKFREAIKAAKKLKQKHAELVKTKEEWTIRKFGKVVKLKALEKHLRNRNEEKKGKTSKMEPTSSIDAKKRDLEKKAKEMEEELTAVTRENTRKKTTLRRLQEKKGEVEAKLSARRSHLAWLARRGLQYHGMDLLNDQLGPLLYKIEAQAAKIDNLTLQILAFRSKAIPAPRPMGSGFELF